MQHQQVFVVDDDPIVANLIELRLKKMGYGVSGVSHNGTDALEKIRGCHTDVVIMDINLPGSLDGIQTAGKIAASHDIPVVYLTGDQNPTTFERAKSGSECQYLVKPFKDSDLHIAIQLAISRHDIFKEVSRQNRFCQSILSSVSDGIIATDTEGFVSFMNPAAQVLTGVQSISGRKTHVRELVSIISNGNGQAMENPVDLVTRTADIAGFPQDAVLINHNREKIHVDGWAGPLYDEKGNPKGILLYISPKPRKNLLKFTGKVLY
ncbi:CheY-like chemotaxis protein [Methanolinea mesophila]|uniref:ATP-binding response regulator n=1 Tax=Methanolinea mesophila TaxID=547055 RepID=UPI001AE28C1E|nr:response regulator [Methanolinea mesophila]MBP1927950.1 CheY-like chemotaxis protein [Methanolinea mesophila]